MRRIWVPWSMLVLGAACAGCGSDSDSDVQAAGDSGPGDAGADTGADVAPEAAAYAGPYPDKDSFVAAYCALVADCCAPAGLNPAGCEQTVKSSFWMQYNHYHPVQGELCLEALEQAKAKGEVCSREWSPDGQQYFNPCPQLFSMAGRSGHIPIGGDCKGWGMDGCEPSRDFLVDCVQQADETEICMHVERGKVGDGPCVYSWDEVGGNGQILPLQEQATTVYICLLADGVFCGETSRKCEAASTAGGDCPCAPGNYCDTTDWKCKAAKADGTPCSDGQCQQGSFCKTDFDIDSVCTKLVADGQECKEIYSTGGLTDQWCQSFDCTDHKCVPIASKYCGQ